MRKYKLRFEAVSDVIEFIRIMGEFLHDFKSGEGYTLIFETDMRFSHILYNISKIPDGHVMFETVAEYDKYTGDRSDDNYDYVEED
jgi:hypothetical protein